MRGSTLGDLLTISPEHTLFGIKFAHSYASLIVFDRLFDLFKFEQVFEFGTYEGGLSSFLWLECLVRKKIFLSVDKRDIRKFDMFPFKQGDLLKDDDFCISLRELFAQGKALLYCDNGNKLLEIKRYAPFLVSGSILGVHDVGVEVKLHDLEFLRGLNYTPIKPLNEMSSELKTRQFFWQRL